MPSPSIASKKTRPKDSIKAQRDKAPVTLIHSSKNPTTQKPLRAAQKSPSVVWRTPSVAKLTQHHRHSLTIPSSSSQTYKSQIIAAQSALTSSSTLPAQRNKSIHDPIPTFSSMSFSSSNSIRSHTSMNSTYL